MAPTGFVGQEPPRGKTGIMFRKNKPYFLRLREKFEVQEDKGSKEPQACNFFDEDVTGAAEEIVRLHPSSSKEIGLPAIHIGWNLQWNFVTGVSEEFAGAPEWV
ncbi:hypothetical protein NpNSSI1_00001187 [Neofusicoccum parvum]|nr:hypothetical protein NpNSSI1_00001187 [Neofusicoccum parvum]